MPLWQHQQHHGNTPYKKERVSARASIHAGLRGFEAAATPATPIKQGLPDYSPPSAPALFLGFTVFSV
jgi:hypothetical protein